jgi:aryl-alcohol dehydrogenase-like predicted oxidoreductase
MIPSTRFGLGMAALGRPAYINVGHAEDFAAGRSLEAMERQAHAVLDAAFEFGIRYVDAARSYGEAEVFVRSWLDARKLAPGTVTVASKWGYVYEANWHLQAPVHERKEHSLAMLHRQSLESLSILGDHLSLYQIHSATQESGVLEDEPLLDELARLRDHGLRIGFTTSGAAQADVVRMAATIERGGTRLFESVQSTFNVLEPSCEDALREAHDLGMVVVVKEALANGRLTARGDAGALPAIASIAAAHGSTPDAVALAAVLAKPWADRVLLGPSTSSQLESNLRSRQLSLTTSELEQLGALRVPAADYWDGRSLLSWN